MSALNEFTMNLPMIGTSPIGNTVSELPAEVPADQVPAEPEMYDVTADTELPACISPECSHITVSVDSASGAGPYSDSSPEVFVDLVLNVNIMEKPEDGSVGYGTTRTYKIVKRVSLDKLKLAFQAESETPVSIVEALSPEALQKQAASARAAQRARQLAGLE